MKDAVDGRETGDGRHTLLIHNIINSGTRTPLTKSMTCFRLLPRCPGLGKLALADPPRPQGSIACRADPLLDGGPIRDAGGQMTVPERR
jgi:hypothetical protein